MITFLTTIGLGFSQLAGIKTNITDINNNYMVIQSVDSILLHQSQHTTSQKSAVMENVGQKNKKEESEITVNISGIWESNIGWKYNIKQKGENFTWEVINRSQTATGTIAENNKDIQAEWSDESSKGTAKGLILEVDEKGKATFIEWDNGVFFHRE